MDPPRYIRLEQARSQQQLKMISVRSSTASRSRRLTDKRKPVVSDVRHKIKLIPPQLAGNELEPSRLSPVATPVPIPRLVIVKEEGEEEKDKDPLDAKESAPVDTLGLSGRTPADCSVDPTETVAWSRLNSSNVAEVGDVPFTTFLPNWDELEVNKEHSGDLDEEVSNTYSLVNRKEPDTALPSVLVDFNIESNVDDNTSLWKLAESSEVVSHPELDVSSTFFRSILIENDLESAVGPI